MISTGGPDYYTAFFQELTNNGISIIADLYHYDMPVIWQDVGGWTNNSIIDAFEEYARNCFDLYGQYVSVWMPLAAPLREVSLWSHFITFKSHIKYFPPTDNDLFYSIQYRTYLIYHFPTSVKIQQGYMGNTWPPFYNDVEQGLKAVHNMIITQARVWHAYDQDYR